MQVDIDKTNRQRENQEAFNKKHNITPKTIKKDVRELIRATVAAEDDAGYETEESIDVKKLSKKEKDKVIEKMEKEMREDANELNFESETEHSDIILDL